MAVSKMPAHWSWHPGALISSLVGCIKLTLSTDLHLLPEYGWRIQADKFLEMGSPTLRNVDS
jgi:hypothetical protein